MVWRNNIVLCVMKRFEVEEGFEVFDLDDRVGWRLVKGFMVIEGCL